MLSDRMLKAAWPSVVVACSAKGRSRERARREGKTRGRAKVGVNNGITIVAYVTSHQHQ